MKHGYLDSFDTYYEGDYVPGDRIVPLRPAPGYEWNPAVEEWMEPPDTRTTKQKLKDIITAGQEAMASDPLPPEVRLKIYSLEATTDIAFDRNDNDAVLAAVTGFNAGEDDGLTPDQLALVTGLKSQMLAILVPEG